MDIKVLLHQLLRIFATEINIVKYKLKLVVCAVKNNFSQIHLIIDFIGIANV